LAFIALTSFWQRFPQAVLGYIADPSDASYTTKPYRENRKRLIIFIDLSNAYLMSFIKLA